MSDLSLPPLTLVPIDDELQRAQPAAAAAGPAVQRAEAFAWPTPPLAAYPMPTHQVEPEPCVIEGRAGNFIAGLLTVFEPYEGLVRVQVLGEKVALPVRFEQMRRLVLKRPLRALADMPDTVEAGLDPAQASVLAHTPAQPYEIVLSNGSLYSGRTIGHVETEAGYFLFEPQDGHGTVERSFVPRAMIECATLGEPLGNLLTEGNAERGQQVEQGLAAQQQQRTQKLGDILLARQVVTREQLYVALDKQARLPLVRLGEALVALGFVTEDQLQQALAQQDQARQQLLGEVLVHRGLVGLDEVRVALARKMGYPVVDVATFPVDPDALRSLPQDTARRLGALPLLRRGGRLVVALLDATREDVLSAVRDAAQCEVLPALAGSGDLQAAIERAWRDAGQADAAAMPSFPVLTTELDASAAPAAPKAQAARPAAAQGRSAAPVAQAPQSPALANALAQAEAARAIGGAAHSSSAAVTAHGDAGSELRGRARLERADSPIVQALVALVVDALGRGASALHLESLPGDDTLHVRLRRDGRLESLPDLPAALRHALIPRIKALAEMDVTETRRPQQGRLAFGRLASAHRHELAVTTVPTQAGLEDLVIALPSQLKPMKLDGLGLASAELERYQALLARPSGLILHTGPARCGRTTSLHAALAHVNRPERRLWSIEDRLELSQPGLRQMEIRPHGARTVEDGLRAVLQADADVIMVGDLRESGAARLAVEAAASGKLVLAGLPARNASEALMRLLDLGVEPWNLADALLGVHGQRLVKRLCSACRMSRPAKDSEVDEWLDAWFVGAAQEPTLAEREAVLRGWIERYGRDGKLRRYQSPGCTRCAGSGSRSRTAVHELLVPGRELRRLLRAGAPAWNLHRQAVKDGMRTLRQDAIEKMLAGVLPLDEVRSCCME